MSSFGIASSNISMNINNSSVIAATSTSNASNNNTVSTNNNNNDDDDDTTNTTTPNSIATLLQEDPISWPAVQKQAQLEQPNDLLHRLVLLEPASPLTVLQWAIDEFPHQITPQLLQLSVEHHVPLPTLELIIHVLSMMERQHCSDDADDITTEFRQHDEQRKNYRETIIDLFDDVCLEGMPIENLHCLLQRYPCGEDARAVRTEWRVFFLEYLFELVDYDGMYELVDYRKFLLILNTVRMWDETHGIYELTKLADSSDRGDDAVAVLDDLVDENSFLVPHTFLLVMIHHYYPYDEIDELIPANDIMDMLEELQAWRHCRDDDGESSVGSSDAFHGIRDSIAAMVITENNQVDDDDLASVEAKVARGNEIWQKRKAAFQQTDRDGNTLLHYVILYARTRIMVRQDDPGDDDAWGSECDTESKHFRQWNELLEYLVKLHPEAASMHNNNNAAAAGRGQTPLHMALQKGLPHCMCMVERTPLAGQIKCQQTHFFPFQLAAMGGRDDNIGVVGKEGDENDCSCTYCQSHRQRLSRGIYVSEGPIPGSTIMMHLGLHDPFGFGDYGAMMQHGGNAINSIDTHHQQQHQNNKQIDTVDHILTNTYQLLRMAPDVLMNFNIVASANDMLQQDAYQQLLRKELEVEQLKRQHFKELQQMEAETAKLRQAWLQLKRHCVD